MENTRPNSDRQINQLAVGTQIQQLPKSAEVDHASLLPKAEGQRHRDKDDLRMTNQWPPHQYTEGEAGNATQSQFRRQMPHPEMGLGKRSEQDMEVGYEDSPSRLTLEALEKKFHDETMKLAKEESDADDAENARHREKKIEMSKEYQVKLAELHALQAKKREEFLYKETQERLYQYRQQQQHQQQQLQQLQSSNNYPMDREILEPCVYRPHTADSRSRVDPRGYDTHHYPTEIGSIDSHLYGQNHYPADHRGYGGPASIEPPHGDYGPGPHEHYRERERSPYSQVQRHQEAEGRVPIPQGRSYNNTRARNF